MWFKIQSDLRLYIKTKQGEGVGRRFNPDQRLMSQENLIKLKCSVCKRGVYFSFKNKKLVTRKIELKKFCKICRKHQVFKEVKLTA